MAFPIDPGRPPGIQPLEDQVPNQGNVDPRAMLPLANVREQQHHDVRQHAGLGHGQHDDHDMNLEDMLPLRQAFNLDQDDAMLEDDNNQTAWAWLKTLACKSHARWLEQGEKSLVLET